MQCSPESRSIVMRRSAMACRCLTSSAAYTRCSRGSGRVLQSDNAKLLLVCTPHSSLSRYPRLALVSKPASMASCKHSHACCCCTAAKILCRQCAPFGSSRSKWLGAACRCTTAAQSGPEAHQRELAGVEHVAHKDAKALQPLDVHAAAMQQLDCASALK
jgi:hypothetical protein